MICVKCCPLGGRGGGQDGPKERLHDLLTLPNRSFLKFVRLKNADDDKLGIGSSHGVFAFHKKIYQCIVKTELIHAKSLKIFQEENKHI